MRETTIADAIALKVLNKNAILAGVANELHLHTSCGSTKCIERLQGKVHGIELGRHQLATVLVYGEKEFMLLQWTESGEKHHFYMRHRAFLSDWISSARCLNDKREFVVLTAHSVLLRFAYDWETYEIVARSSCTDKSTLYCAHLHGHTWSDLVVFGGNAFGEILVWRPSLLEGDKAPLLHRQQMHNGVIFSIDYNASAALLTTTSDDRSIRFWQVALAGESWSAANLLPVASGYGHVARVFQGRVIDCGRQLYAVSVGEDSYFCLWRLNGELVYKRRHQFGATIWNFDYDTETQTLYTVGSTGNILAYGLREILADEQQRLAWTLPPVCLEDETDYVAKIRFLAQDMLVGVTNKNLFVCNRLSAMPENSDWQAVADVAGYKCTVLEVHEDLIALCGYRRLILMRYEHEKDEFVKLFDGALLSGVIRAFQFLDATTFLVSDEQGDCLLLHGAETPLRSTAIELPKCKERWLTTALKVGESFLLLSNRLGNLMLYALNADGRYDLKDTLKQPHGNLGATALVLLTSDESVALVRSAGHDGGLRTLRIDKQAATLRSCTRETVPVAWVEHLLADAGAELLLGFNDNHLVAWSARQDFALQVPCGGGHRCWHYTIDEESTTSRRWLQVAFIKKKQVLLQRMPLHNEVTSAVQLPARNSWHVKACNIMTILEDWERTILFSAGEDNLLKISAYYKASGTLSQLAEVHSHISNIRALHIVHENAAESCLIFSGGGRAQLCLTQFNLRTHQVSDILSHTLKATNAGVAPAPKQQDYNFDPETRIMACDVLKGDFDGEESYSVYLGCSDGYVRRLRLRLGSRLVGQLTASGELNCGRCVLQLRIVADAYVLVAATDGILKLHNLALDQTLLQFAHHSSGVNALDVLYLRESRLLHVLTGGDDQAVAYSVVQMAGVERDKTTALIQRALHLPYQHTAQVTAARLCRTTEGAIFAFTSGVNQRLVKLNLATEHVELSRHGYVADVKGVCVDSQQCCYIYGCGLQVLDCSS